MQKIINLRDNRPENRYWFESFYIDFNGRQKDQVFPMLKPPQYLLCAYMIKATSSKN